MTMQISTNNRIIIDGQDTGLAVTQRRNQTVVYTPEKAGGQGGYQEHAMPHPRYSTAHPAPSGAVVGTNWRGKVTTQEMIDKRPKTAGCLQFEADLRDLLKRL